LIIKAPKSSHITPILRSLHWLKNNERIEYKLLSLTYKVLTTSQPDYLHNLISVQPSGRTRSSSVVTLARPSISSSLQITNRSFKYISPHLWNQLPSSFRQPQICSLSSWFTSSSAYHLITVTTFKLIKHRKSSLSQILSSIVTLIPSGLHSRILTCTELEGHWRLFVLVSSFYIFFWLRVLDKAELLSFRVHVNLFYRSV